MVPEALRERVTELVIDLVEEIGDMDPSVEGYLDLLNLAQEEIQVAINAAKCDLNEEWEALG